MSFSNTSLNMYAACQRKYYHNYIAHSPKCKPTPLYFKFGEMAHEVLEKAGLLRDNIESGVEDYSTVIPSEVLYDDLKREFRITNWHSYFTNVCKQVAKYEKQEIEAIALETSSPIEIQREINLQADIGGSEPLVGIVDLLLMTEDKQYATIIDYKFSSTLKTQDDFDMNSQLYIYAFLVNKNFGVPLHNIKIGYIDIVRADFERPIVLSNGQLSRAKSQNTSQEMYIACVKAIWPNEAEELLSPGGYYYDIVQELANRKIAYLNSQWLDIDVYNGVLHDVLNVILDLTNKKLSYDLTKDELKFNARYDAYTCKSCEYVDVCKPWIKGRLS